MQVTVEVVGEGERTLELDVDATYGDVVRGVGYNTQEATVLVDGTPVPEDAPVDTDRMTVLRLIKGGVSRVNRDGDRRR
ncbi:Sulfur transfer protein involved in thiamine biosynthesis [Halalkaliarchaeum sp. AArc-CO]|uniref:ubiquitin-like small modifier protein SAMP2 n=1 Tax=unclassified Halalkaliarchaeum TaxID=2678344 RepID=UPI00217ECF91|nr:MULTISPECIES: ubiquitin-like small modifier protein 2 [unclassified Halalkaliarchaeum]MDR5673385.1 ubiquitin-like small modifier protein 2 [Halalkaliarchaeum sp. AArc-GB]UWG49726.1 Sulfur transfer protein involved in thiamine biosynthesis [Halalkaliarchaeum sp. AArc-CO]